MFETLLAMLKEEWRMHSSLFGNFLFASFPVIIAIFSFIIFSSIPTIAALNQALIIIHYLFILVGLSVGTFGLLGREAMNRRFGHASLIAFSSRTLPMSEKFILFNFFVKDVIYYFIFWIIPFILGFAAFSIIKQVVVAHILLISLGLSFLLGLSTSFLLSTIYVHSKKVAILLIAILSFIFSKYFQSHIPSISFFLQPSLSSFIVSLALSSLMCYLSILFFKSEYSQVKRYKNSFDKLSSCNLKNSHFIAKDFLDLNRSEGGLAKLIFSMVLPTVIIWLVLLNFIKFIPIANFILVFSILLGVVSSSTYNWLTEFDLFSSYYFMPVKVSTIIKSKIISYAIINSIGIIALMFIVSRAPLILPAIFSYISVSAYILSVNIYLSGLHPNLLLYNSKILLKYLLMIAPVLVLLIFLSGTRIYLLTTLFLFIISYFITKASIKEWDKKEEIVF